jgi:quercetin dioxygenase-like cupin family protein
MSEHRSFHPKVLLRSEESAGAVGVVESHVPPGWEGPPLHHHPFDEGFYVLEGELTFQLGEELRSATPGDFVFAPADAVHTFANLSDAPARYLIVVTPGGFEPPRSRASSRPHGRSSPTPRRPWSARESRIVTRAS